MLGPAKRRSCGMWRAHSRGGAHSRSPPNEGEQMRSEVSLVTLCGEALPCGDCGQIVMVPEPATVVNLERVRRGRVTRVLMAKCRTCLERDRMASDLAERYFRTGVAVGERRYIGKAAVELLVEARTAFDAVGALPVSVEAARNPAAALAAEVMHMSRGFGALRWRERINAPDSLVADPIELVEPGTASTRRWAHIGADQRARIVMSAVKVLNDRIAILAPPVALGPPRLVRDEMEGRGTPVCSGCLYCGIGMITLSALAVVRRGGDDAAAKTVWTQRQVNPVSLGARRGGPSRVVGWLCPDCERAAAYFGSASSASAMEDALSEFLGVSRRSLAGDELWVAGLKGWGALVADAMRAGRELPAPNPGRWDHLSRADRDDLAHLWRRGGS